MFAVQQRLIALGRLVDRALHDPARGFVELVRGDVQVVYNHSGPSHSCPAARPIQLAVREARGLEAAAEIAPLLTVDNGVEEEIVPERPEDSSKSVAAVGFVTGVRAPPALRTDCRHFTFFSGERGPRRHCTSNDVPTDACLVYIDGRERRLVSMFRKILIANRGEIAIRIIIACRELGIRTVAVYSQADEHSLHVRFADEDVCIGPPRSADSYLSVPAIISAAEVTGADAIHPGYGFLSESAYLAEVCQACHISFIGPDPDVVRLLGDKARARKAIQKAGLPMLPGSDGPVRSEACAFEVAKHIGYPLIIKAVAGGGGRGMRIVRCASELRSSLQAAQREAEAAFGNGAVYVEKYLENARHIEFQILADHHGTVVHLGERECSIQRRHQKLLEESPSPSLTPSMRRRMGQLVVNAAKAVQYTNAGTFEFLMDDEERFYYMETNTRLQVEHPVTEMVTGIDIVKEQIRIAAGERLSFKQSDVRFTGHSIECRVNAEDPETFAPSPGVVKVFHVLGGPGVRVDSLAHSECTISPYYDSMIAKIVVHGRDRHEAIARMRRTLEMTVIEGIRTSVPLHLKILNDADFQAGRLTTSFMDRFIAKPNFSSLAATA
jgi:acetyl-CoA carboxylase biotin carboxylase subunit